MPTPTPADQPAIALADARNIARRLNTHQARQLRAIVDRDLTHGWDDMRINRALHNRGLVNYTVSDVSRHTGGGVWKTRGEVTDVKPTEAARIVLEVYDLLSAPDAYTGTDLGSDQETALRALDQNNAGRWWPGCGWSMGTGAAFTVRVLESLARRGLAERGATVAGDPKFTITAMGRSEARPLVMRLSAARFARQQQHEEPARS